ncbi:MAG: sulfatase-like hydrolase/transferase, partial [Akkermansiaceae bacterium]|nr:sulfatase-like hydrolase/transferase [Akkermansiaceae bacterium]
VWDHRYRLNRPPYTRTWHRNHGYLDEKGHSTDLVTAEAIRWMTSIARDRPFLCYVPFHAVHTPLAEKDERWFAMNAHHPDPDRRHFAAYVSHMDDCVGRLVAALKKLNRFEDAIIIFTSDNGGLTGGYGGGAYPAPDPKLKAGFSSNKPLRGGKSTSWEGGIRVPAFVRGPGFPRKTMSAPMHVVDWLPTLATAAGCELPDMVDGVDLLAHLDRPPPDRAFYTVWGGTGRRVALRQGDWKIRSDRKGDKHRWELYNLRRDPSETTDLAAEHPGRRDALAALFRAERAKDFQPATP